MYLLFFKIVNDSRNLRYKETKVNNLAQIDNTIENFCTAIFITVKLENVAER